MCDMCVCAPVYACVHVCICVCMYVCVNLCTCMVTTNYCFLRHLPVCIHKQDVVSTHLALKLKMGNRFGKSKEKGGKAGGVGGNGGAAAKVSQGDRAIVSIPHIKTLTAIASYRDTLHPHNAPHHQYYDSFMTCNHSLPTPNLSPKHQAAPHRPCIYNLSFSTR